MDNSAPAYFVAPSGETIEVPADQAPELIGARDYVPLDPKSDLVRDYVNQKQYGGAGQQALAGAEGVARGLTLGLSTPLETGVLGVDPEDIAGRQQANPGTAAATEAGGNIAGLLGPEELLSGPALVAKAGKSVAGLVPRASASAAGRIARGVLAAGAGSATEGAFYGAGRLVHEAALGDPHMTAQSALASVGTTAAIFGAIGGVGGMFGGLAREATPAELGEKVAGMLDDAEAHGNLNSTNAMPGLIKGVLRGKDDAAKIGLEGRDLGILRNPLVDSPDAILERAGDVVEQGGEEMDAVLKQADASPNASLFTYAGIESEIRPLVRALRKQGATYRLADQFEGLLDDFRAAHDGGDILTLSDLHDLRRDFDKFVYTNGKTLDPWGKAINEPMSAARGRINEILKDGIKRAGGDLDAWKAANRKVEVGSTFATLAQSGVDRGAANNAIHLSGMMGAVAGGGIGGLPGAIAAGIGSEILRRRGAAMTGYGLRMLRDAMSKGGSDVAGRTAEFVAAERQAAASGIPQGAPSEIPRASVIEQGQGALDGALSVPGPKEPIQTLGVSDLTPETSARISGAVGRAPVSAADLSPETRAAIDAEVSQDAIASQATREPIAVAVLAKLERMNKSVARKIDSGAGSVISMKPGATSASTRTAEAIRAAYQKDAAHVSALAGDPKQLHAALMRQVDGWSEHAPRVAEAMQFDSARAISYLAAQLPSPPTVRGPLSPPWSPSTSQMAAWNRQRAVIDDPTLLLRRASEGTLTLDEVRAVATVYPQIVQRMHAALMRQIASRGVESIPYRSRMMLSMLFGQDMDGSLSTASLMMAKSAFAPALEPAVKVGSKKLGFASRSQTPLQQSTGRL